MNKVIAMTAGIIGLSGCMQNPETERRQEKDYPQGYRFEKVLCEGAKETDSESKFGGGDGTRESPYLICTPEQFFAIGLNDMRKPFYRVTKDLDFSQYPGFGAYTIAGKLDGGGHTFKNIRYDLGKNSSQDGLITVLTTHPNGEPDELKNLTIENLEIRGKSSSPTHGGVVGVNWGGIIENVHVKGRVEVQTDEVGGIAGTNHGVIRDSSFSGGVVGLNAVGGVTGQNFGVIQNCSASGSVSGESNIGGIAGMQPRSATLEQSSFHGNVTGKLHVNEQLGSWCQDSECRYTE